MIQNLGAKPMASQLLALREYLTDVVVRSGFYLQNGKGNVTAFCDRFNVPDELIPRPTFSNIFSKETTPSLETIVKITLIVNAAKKSMGEDPVTPRSIGKLVPSLIPILDALDSFDDRPNVKTAEIPQGGLVARTVVENFRSLGLGDRLGIVPDVLNLCAETIAISELHGIKKLQYLVRTLEKRRSKGLREFWEYYWPAEEIRFEILRQIYNGEIPKNPPVKPREIESLIGFIEATQDLTLLTFTAEDLECLKSGKKR
jgi:hypothetical protein